MRSMPLHLPGNRRCALSCCPLPVPKACIRTNSWPKWQPCHCRRHQWQHVTLALCCTPVMRCRKNEKKCDVRLMNIEAAKAVADAIRTSLGPRGMDKMVRHSGPGRGTPFGCRLPGISHEAWPAQRFRCINRPLQYLPMYTTIVKSPARSSCHMPAHTTSALFSCSSFNIQPPAVHLCCFFSA